MVSPPPHTSLVADERYDELLERVGHGETVELTRDGRVVARVLPSSATTPRVQLAHEIVKRGQEMRQRLNAEGRTASIDELIKTSHEGHKH